MKDGFSPKRIEEAAKARDVVERARAAGGSGGALAQAADRLRSVHDQGRDRF